ncbi:MAG: dihydroorotase [Planctomycetota bacterium]|nr:MAG: dihydroorotase [Planctomycetota bacterium]
MSSLVISGGRVIDPANSLDAIADVLILDGKIAAVTRRDAGFAPLDVPHGIPVIEATGRIVCPGFIDPHVSLREPGFEEDECTATGTAAALAGGFTTIAAQSDTYPVVDHRAAAEFIRLQADRARNCRVYPLGAVTKESKGEELAEIGQLVQGGAVGFSDAKRPVANAEVMRRALEYTRMFNRPILHFAMVPELSDGGVMHEGFEATRLGFRGIPAAAQDIMTGRDIALAELTGGRIHLMCVTTMDSVERIRKAKSLGISVTADVTPHHLLLTDEVMRSFETMYKCNPPLRSQEHVDALIAGLQDGTLSAISSDHQPLALEKKQVDMDTAPFGICGIETLLPVCIRALIEPGHLTWLQLIARLTTGPAAILSVNHGTLSVGQPADVTVIDPAKTWTVRAHEFYSRSRNTPFEGAKFTGKVVTTIVDGEIRFQNNRQPIPD